jgi:hypothetical protein
VPHRVVEAGALGVAVVGSAMSSLYAAGLSDGVPEAAREAFVDAMSTASIAVALVAAFGAFVAWRYLPVGAT